MAIHRHTYRKPPCPDLSVLAQTWRWKGIVAHPLQGRAIPALVDIIKAPEAHSPVLLEGTLDVLAVLLAPSAREQAAGVHAAASSHVMALALHQDDAGVLQSCSEYLRYSSDPD